MLDYYATRQWQEIKQAAIEAAGGKCEFCGASAETAHHVKYPRKMGTEDPRTLIAVCWRCHGLLHGKRTAATTCAYSDPHDLAWGLFDDVLRHAFSNYKNDTLGVLGRSSAAIVEALIDAATWSREHPNASLEQIQIETCGNTASLLCDIDVAEEGPDAT